MEQFNISENRAAIFLGMINGIVIQGNVDPRRVNLKAVFEELIGVMNLLLSHDLEKRPAGSE